MTMSLHHHDGSELRLGHVTNSIAARERADRIDATLGITTERFDGPAASGLPAAWVTCDVIVSHLALGATTRLIAPLLHAKASDPGVVVLDEGGHFAVALLGGHARSANRVAHAIAEAIDARAVVTTATDSLGYPALDTLGWPFTGDVAAVTRALLDGAPVDIDNPANWPLPELPENASPAASGAAGRVLITDMDPRVARTGTLPTVVLSPPSLLVGMGCNRGTPLAELRAHLEEVLETNLLARASIAALVTAQVKADEEGLVALAGELGVPLRTFAAEQLATAHVPTPSAIVQAEVGTPSVAEASVVTAGARLIVPKHKTSESTVAIGRREPQGRLTVVGIGPGAADLITPRARSAVTQAGVVVGYTVYVDQVRGMLSPGTRVFASGMGTEESRARTALEQARAGYTVALVCSGDPAIYAMASPTLQVAAADIDEGRGAVAIDIVPGVTASLASSAVLGAPLGHDHVTLSLSDLHTDWRAIERRARAAAEGDFVTVLYNPRSRTRTWQLPTVLEIMAEHRPPSTPVAVVENASRPEQRVVQSTLAQFDACEVTMFGMVVIGSSTTRFLDLGGVGGVGGGRDVIVTPRDYDWMEE